ncbi:MAG TPA: glycine cleavage system protein H [Mucilaginibacter sp.]|jgi:glycine cleavage system H protein
MNDPGHLHFTKGHQWLRFESQYAFMGLTDFGQKQLAGMLDVHIPYLHQTLQEGRFLGAVEAVQSVMELFMPLAGTIVEINTEILQEPGLVNRKPYDTWIVKIEYSTTGTPEPLLTAEEYRLFTHTLT